MKPALLALILAAGSLFAETRVSIGIGIGAPFYYAPPLLPVVAYSIPPCPGPGYTWVAGYWYPVGLRYHWHDGYWALPPYPGSYWVAPATTNTGIILATGSATSGAGTASSTVGGAGTTAAGAIVSITNVGADRRPAIAARCS